MYLKKKADRCNYLKDLKQHELIMARGFPHPWDFNEGSESGFAGQDYEDYWSTQEEEMGMYCTPYDPENDC